MSNIVLSMIVRDEARHIERCLDSVKKYVDSFCIVDTGSEDKTPQIIEHWLLQNEKEGEVLHHRWFDYSTNRNAALDEVRGRSSPDDHIMVMDADDVFYTTHFDRNLLSLGHEGFKGSYWLDKVSFYRPFIIKAHYPWKYYGECHEVLLRHPNDDLANIPILPHSRIQCNEGITGKPKEHFLKHAQLLEGKTDPRSIFYLAQSYHMAKEYDKAAKLYLQRSRMDGNKEETFLSFLRLGEMTDEPGCYLRAIAINDTRQEPWWELYQWSKKHGLSDASMFLKEAAMRNKPQGMFIDTGLNELISKAIQEEMS